MKATEQFFPVVLFIMLSKVVLTFKTVDKLLMNNHSMKAAEQHFPVVVFMLLSKVVLTFKTVDKLLMYDNSNESY